jgi:hypothetical protein
MSSRQFGSAPSSFFVSYFNSLLSTDGETGTSGGLLLGETGSDLISLGNFARLFEAVELDVAVAAQVWGDSTVGSVGSSTAVHSSLADGVVDPASVNIESLSFGIGAQVDEHLADGLDGLFRPSTEGGLFVDLDLGVSSTTIPYEGDNFSVFKAVLKVADSFVDLETLDGTSDVVAVLVVSSQVSNSASSGFSGFFGLS